MDENTARFCEGCGKKLNSYNKSNRCYACQNIVKAGSLKHAGLGFLNRMFKYLDIDGAIPPWVEKLGVLLDECPDSNPNCQNCPREAPCRQWWDREISPRQSIVKQKALDEYVRIIKRDFIGG